MFFPEDKVHVPGSPGRRRDDPALSLCLPLPDEYSDRDRLSPDFYEESETDPGAEEPPARIFVALFDYDPLSMSPNPDAAEEELPFKEGQIIKVGMRAALQRGSGRTGLEGHAAPGARGGRESGPADSATGSCTKCPGQSRRLTVDRSPHRPHGGLPGRPCGGSGVSRHAPPMARLQTRTWAAQQVSQHSIRSVPSPAAGGTDATRCWLPVLNAQRPGQDHAKSRVPCY